MSNARLSIIPSKAVSDPRISAAQFRTLAALGTFGDRNGWCYPSLKTLGDMLGKSQQAVSRDIQALQKFGYLNITPQFDKATGSRKSNLYQIKLDYPLQLGVEAPSTSEVEAPSTSEVEVTSHNNDPIKEGEDKKQSSKKPRRKRDDRLDHPAVIAYREVAHLTPPHAARDSLCEVDDVGRWRAVVKKWIVKGWNPRNIFGMLDVYKNGERDNRKGSEVHSPRPVEVYE